MFLCVYHLKKHQVVVFFMLFNYFDVIVLEIKKIKKIILIYVQVKNIFEKHLTPQYQTHK
jgi:hypothetical protein